MPHREKILVVMPSWIGDTVMSHPLLAELQSNFNDCEIDVLARPFTRDLLDLIPQINKKYFLDVEHGQFGFSKRLNLVRELKQRKYTKTYILTNSFKSSIIPWLAGIPERIGYSTELRHLLLTKRFKYKKHERTMVERYLHLVNKKYNSRIRPRLKIDTSQKNKIKSKFNIQNEKNIMLCPDAEFGSSKKWPIEHWISLAKTFQENGFNVYFLGKDESISSSIIDNINSDSVVSLIGTTSLLDVIYILSLADLTISNDSGLMHIAGAVDSKIIAIYGSSSPFYTPPLISEDFGEVVYKELSCSPCFKKECPLSHLNCLRSITSKEIYDISLRYL